jgi:hypothetical protein
MSKHYDRFEDLQELRKKGMSSTADIDEYFGFSKSNKGRKNSKKKSKKQKTYGRDEY